MLEKIIALERPDGILATVGGQTALNLSKDLDKAGILSKYNVAFMGTNADAIEKAENREEFNKVMNAIHVPILPGMHVKTKQEAFDYSKKIGYPVIVRPSFTLGGSGSGIAKNEEELSQTLDLAFRLSTIHEALIERSIVGWGEFEYEVVIDANGNGIIVCTMENLDPMGVHTGESIVTAPTQTLNDDDHQMLRNAALNIVRALGVKGGCNVQFALNQKTGEYVVIEVNPRLSRSSALASKATGYPIARVATKIALGYSLHEIKNAITGTNAAFEPALDYVVTKIPRWPFDKFQLSDRTIGTQMKSTGETMAIGRTFEESLLKALRGLEIKWPLSIDYEKLLMPPNDLRMFALLEALRNGMTIEELHAKTFINKWFLEKIRNIVKMETELKASQLTRDVLIRAKEMGFSDVQIARLKNAEEHAIRKIRKEMGIIPTYKIVDSCAGEFVAISPYYYSTYEQENEATPLEGRKVIILGSGPIRIGQGIEFDYCCCHASFALRKMGIKSIVINNNPETVSTDFDSSDRLYFEPLTFEDVMNIIENENPEGVIVQLGGQTSINLAEKLEKSGVKILGTSLEGIDIAEDRELFRQLLQKLEIPQPANGTGLSEKETEIVAEKIGYPIVVRPSWVIAGRGMRIIYSVEELHKYIEDAVSVSEDKPILIDKYIDNAIECEVDAIDDGKTLFIGAIQEHIERAGVHSGDANIVIPTLRLTPKEIALIEEYTLKISRALKTKGFINIQYIVKNGIVYVLEANPRASRTVPFVSKMINVPLTKLATSVMVGNMLDPKLKRIVPSFYAVKSVVFPFLKLKGTDTMLGPEMRSTGETMGIARTFEQAYYKALLATGIKERKGTALLSLKEDDKKAGKELKKRLEELGYSVIATPGTATAIGSAHVSKIGKGTPDCLELITSDKIQLIVNTPKKGGNSQTDGFRIRRAAIEKGIPVFTEIETASNWLDALIHVRKGELEVREVREYGK